MIHFMTGFVIIANAGVNIIALIVTIMISIIASIIKNTSVINIINGTYADWSPHCEWIEPLLHEFEKPVNIVRVNIESNRKVADAYEIEIAPSFVLQRKGKMLWEKTGEVFPGELRDVIEMFKN